MNNFPVHFWNLSMVIYDNYCCFIRSWHKRLYLCDTVTLLKLFLHLNFLNYVSSVSEAGIFRPRLILIYEQVVSLGLNLILTLKRVERASQENHSVCHFHFYLVPSLGGQAFLLVIWLFTWSLGSASGLL